MAFCETFKADGFGFLNPMRLGTTIAGLFQSERVSMSADESRQTIALLQKELKSGVLPFPEKHLL
jgi:hypothetical protein